MPLFAVLAPSDDARLIGAISRAFENRFYKIAPGQFLISARLTTREVSATLGVPDGTVGRAIVIRASNYTGWHAQDMWEWISSQAAEHPSDLPEDQARG